jgi:hypothetical protein
MYAPAGVHYDFEQYQALINKSITQIGRCAENLVKCKQLNAPAAANSAERMRLESAKFMINVLNVTTQAQRLFVSDQFNVGVEMDVADMLMKTDYSNNKQVSNIIYTLIGRPKMYLSTTLRCLYLA